MVPQERSNDVSFITGAGSMLVMSGGETTKNIRGRLFDGGCLFQDSRSGIGGIFECGSLFEFLWYLYTKH